MRIRDLDPNRWKRIAADLNDICDEVCDHTDNDDWGIDSNLVVSHMLVDLERAAMLALFVARDPSMTQDQMRDLFIPGRREPRNDISVGELNKWFNIPCAPDGPA